MSNRYAKYGFANRAVRMTIALIALLLAVVSISSCKSSNNRTASLPEVAIKTAPGEGHAPANGDPFSHPAMQPTWARTARSDAPWKYPGGTTRQVLNDLRYGEGKPPPDNTPWEYFNADGHGSLEEETDLSRVAMQELSRRDKLGLLSAADQREIDQLALAGLNNPITAPGQFYIRRYLGDRWMTGKLPADEAAQLYKMAIRPELVTDSVVMEPDEVLLRLRCNCSLPTSRLAHWDLLATYKSICIDGKPVRRPDKFWRDSSDPNFAFQVDGYATAYEVAKTPLLYSAPGRHQIEVKLQIDIRLGGYKWPEQRPILFSEVITLNSEYREIPPTVAVKVFRFIRDPLQEGFGYLPTAQIQRIIEHPQIGLAKPAMAELMRRGRSAHATAGETQHLVAYMLDLQEDRSRQWIPEYGDYIESLHEQHALSEAQWKQYGSQQLGFLIRGPGDHVIKQGDPLPFEFVEFARRGNSKVRRYTGAQWTLHIDCSQGVTGPVSVADIHMGIDHEGDEYPVQTQATFAATTLGNHTMHAKLFDYDLAWTVRQADLVIPTDYDLGEITFTVVPKTFDVILKAAGDKKIQVIKEVRTATGLGLKEARDLVEGAPKTVKEALSKEDAEKLKKTLEDQGATVELK